MRIRNVTEQTRPSTESENQSNNLPTNNISSSKLPENQPEILNQHGSETSLPDLERVKSTNLTKEMVKHAFDYRRVLKYFGIEDDGKTLDQINNKMTKKLDGKKVKAILIALGSTGDVLHLAHYIKHLDDTLPWLEISRATLTTQRSTRFRVENS